ncbi:MAG: GDSL-type esterase/lipase family protein [Anaerolineae bacterium]
MAKETTVFLFAGDSLTEGVYGASYVERVAAALSRGESGLQGQVVNAGRSGETVASLLARIDGLLEQHRPDWLVLAVGCNDVWLPWLSNHSLGWRAWLALRRLRTGQRPTIDQDRFAAAYRALVDRAHHAGVRVLVCTTSPVGERLSSAINSRVARLNGVIQHVAADRQVPVADVWQAFVESLALLPQRSGYVSAEWLFAWLDRRRFRTQGADRMAQRRHLHLTFDGVHLNSRGADLWAAVVLEALARAERRGAGGPLPESEPATTQPAAARPQPDAGREDKESADLPPLARHLDLPCFRQGPLAVCCSPGREARARDVGRLLAAAYERLSSLTGIHPPAYVAVLSRVHWGQSPCPVAHPAPAMLWDGSGGAIFVADAYDVGFLRDLHLPETVAAWTSWPPALAEVGALARATALADLLAVEELAGLFLRDLRVAPSDPALGRLLAAYLALVVLRGSHAPGAARLAGLWTAWAQRLAEAGLDAGQVRQQARALYAEHGEGLVAWFTSSQPVTRETVEAPPIPKSP